MSTKYYTIEPKPHYPGMFMWIVVVEDDRIVWSQALCRYSNEYTDGIGYNNSPRSYFDEMFYDLVEF